MEIETIRVKANNDFGYMLINKEDMTDEHELYVETADKAAPKLTKKEIAQQLKDGAAPTEDDIANQANADSKATDIDPNAPKAPWAK